MGTTAACWNVRFGGFTLQKLNFRFEPQECAKMAKAVMPMIPADQFPDLNGMSQQVIVGRHDGLHGLEFGLDSSSMASTSSGAKHEGVSVIIPGLERDTWLRRGFCFAHRCGTVTASQQPAALHLPEPAMSHALAGLSPR